jgi:hypothetical protein
VTSTLEARVLRDTSTTVKAAVVVTAGAILGQSRAKYERRWPVSAGELETRGVVALPEAEDYAAEYAKRLATPGSEVTCVRWESMCR